ncbi:MAG: hypothetical protein COB35_05445 [Gammaproteobacteria bacterium]|nr:MAG: hypothetical protein COB35_05445 [Gammaproteobacteria bacterium]
MKKIIALMLLICSSSIFAEQVVTDFKPNFSVGIGLGSNNLNSFQLSGISDEVKSASFYLTLDYQFDEQWAARFQLSDICDYCGVSFSEYQNSIFTEVDYQSTLYGLDAVYKLPISSDFSLELTAGILLGDETVITETCTSNNRGFLGGHCFPDEPLTNNKTSSTEMAFSIGTNLKYQIFESWALQLGVSASNYRQGLTQTNFSVIYQF